MIRALRIGAHLVLTGLVLRIWHAVLLKQWLDRPAVLAAWLAAVFGVVLLERTLARRVPVEERRWATRGWARLDGSGLLFVGLLLGLVFLLHWGYERAASDGREYYVQVRSLVIDWDLDFRNEIETFGVRGTSGDYAFGAAVLWTPFFLACHAWLGFLNLLGGHFPTDGFANPYQRAIGLGTLLYGFAGLILIYRILLDYVSRAVALLSTLLLCAGTFLVWYLVVEDSMVHGVSMFSTTLFLFVWHRTRRDRTVAQWARMGAAAGLMAMVRWQNILFLVVPAIHGLVVAWRTTPPADRARRLGAAAAACGAGLLVAASPQLIFWKIVRGAWISLPVADHNVQFGSLHLGDVLFSPNHGLLSATPLVYLAVLGLPLFFRRDRAFAAVLVLGLVAQVYVNSAVDVWWGGAGFGARRFSSCALAFAVGLACLLDWMRRRPLVAPAAIGSALVFVNVVFMLDVRHGRLPASEGVSFDRLLDSVYERVGNPFSFPLNAIVAWKYDVGMPVYDQLLGRTYNNVTIDLGEADDVRFLGPGWLSREQGPGFSFRWATGDESVVVAPLMASDDYRLELQCGPFAYPEMPAPQAVEVFWNGHEAGTIALDRGLSNYTLQVPEAFVTPKLNQIRFRYRESTSPAAVGLSADARQLSMQCDWIRLTRLLND